jgi:hypothetical protein
MILFNQTVICMYSTGNRTKNKELGGYDVKTSK